MDALHPKISLIFVNYQSAQYLSMALKSLFSFERERDWFEVIVVNNDASERARLQKLQQQYSISIRENAANEGFGKGANKGAEHARGEILGFINPDVLWKGTSLRSIASVFDGDQKVGILGMALLDAAGRPEPWSAGEAPSLACLLRNNFFLSRQRVWSPRSGCLFLDWVSGNGLFIRTALFSEMKGFDENFFLYFEDADLCVRVRKRGYAVIRHGAFPLTHLGGKSHASARFQKKVFYASQKKYFFKHRPRWEAAALTALQRVFFVPR